MNPKKPEEISLTESVLRDYMAIERTVMANERTFLSYVRSALGLFIGGVSFLEFFDSTIMQMVGWVFIPAGIIVFGLGLKKYRHVKGLIQGAGKVVHLEGEFK
jgi:putative membrane protein